MEFVHIPVLLNECLEGLNIKPDGTYVDGTVGGAGHSYQIAKRLSDKGRLICFDQDDEAIAAATERLKEFENVTIVKSNFFYMKNVLNAMGIQKVDGILLDLGVSSHQLDKPERGFSYISDAPLDMRMDKDADISARDIVNEYSEDELSIIIKKYGEERYARNIARNIVKHREMQPINTTGELSKIVNDSIPSKNKKGIKHPEKRAFQAIRIETNKELKVLEEGLSDMIDLLDENGRFCIISFHSLEDRIVKNAFKDAENPCICPPEFPICTCGRKSKGKVVTRKPVEPGEEELEINKRSASSKLRVFERSNGE